MGDEGTDTLHHDLIYSYLHRGVSYVDGVIAGRVRGPGVIHCLGQHASPQGSTNIMEGKREGVLLSDLAHISNLCEVRGGDTKWRTHFSVFGGDINHCVARPSPSKHLRIVLPPLSHPNSYVTFTSPSLCLCLEGNQVKFGLLPHNTCVMKLFSPLSPTVS